MVGQTVCPVLKPKPSPQAHLLYRGSSSSLTQSMDGDSSRTASSSSEAATAGGTLEFEETLREGERFSSVTYGVTYLRGSIPTPGVLTISNYKVSFFATDHTHSLIDRVPIGCIQSVQKVGRQITPGEYQYRIDIYCKDRATIMRFSFKTNAHLRREPFNVLQEAVMKSSMTLRDCFAFQNRESLSGCGWHWYDPIKEFQRMGVPNSEWRVTSINFEYNLCPSYPQYLAVPKWVTDESLRVIADFRVKRRIPMLSWVCKRTKATITRAAQPKVGLLSARCQADEAMVVAIRMATPLLDKLVIIDARPKINATVNRGSGGGYENTSVGYPNAVLQFQDIGNIHVVTDALNRVWDLCRCTESGQVDQLGKWEWARRIERQWLTVVSSVLTASSTIVQHVARGRSCFVHCSDGWDRTSLLTSLAMLCLDPYYRTLKGFAILIEKEWLTAGHPFSLRYGSPTLGSVTSPDAGVSEEPHSSSGSPLSQRSPTFPLFLDCVWQIITQFPRHFQFNANLLRSLGHHHVSCRFGTFLCDTDRERKFANLRSLTKSFWAYVESRQQTFINYDWNPRFLDNPLPLQPNYDLGNLKFWWACYSSQPFGKWERRLLTQPPRNDTLNQTIAPIILST